MPNPWGVPKTYTRRNTHIFSAQGDYLGGTWLNDPPHISNTDFYEMCEHFIEFSSPAAKDHWTLHRLDQTNHIQEPVPRDTTEIKQASYVVLGDKSQPITVTLSEEEAVRRASTNQPSSSHLSANQRHFRDSVFERDECKCAISGFESLTSEEPWLGLDAVHIFPPARHDLWVNGHFEDYINDETDEESIGPSRMFSTQNGLLLDSSVHMAFSNFIIAVNPDKGYCIVAFEQDRRNLGGKVLSPSTRTGESNNRVSDDCLRWHYHQAILTHMRGLGYRHWETYNDFGGGMDMLMDLENAGEILEAEFGSRLAPYLDVK